MPDQAVSLGGSSRGCFPASPQRLDDDVEPSDSSLDPQLAPEDTAALSTVPSSDVGEEAAPTGASGDTSAAAGGAPQHAALEHCPASKLLKTIHINLAACKYSVLRVVTKKLGWVEVGDESAWQVCWTDTSSGTDRLMRMRRPQKLNHFPGMLEIARKKSLARSLSRMAAVFPAHYDFHPRTYLLPEAMEAFLAEFGGGSRGGGGKGAGKGGREGKTFIMKLDNGSQGRGIKLVQSAAAALAAIPTFEHENLVASQYIGNPFLVNGFKFDMRIYVLVRSCDPLRVFIHNEGLARFCTEKYSAPSAANISNNYAHLTNYAVNKHNPAFVFNKDAERSGDGSKWSLTALAAWMESQGHDWGAVWGSIKHLVAKSLVAIQPLLQYHYRSATKPDDDGFTCFEVLGYDVLLDESLRPWLLEVNHSPSFTTDTPLDLAIKETLITQTMHLVGITTERFREELAAREAANIQRLYRYVPAASVPQPHAGVGSAGTASVAAAAGQATAPRSPQLHGQLAPLPAPAQQHAQQQQRHQNECHQQQQQQQQQGATSCGDGPAGHEAVVSLGSSAPCAVSAEWEARQRAHEDAHMGNFERIIPSDDPEKQALYEELQQGAQRVFYKETMQGRLQHALIQIKEKRQQEEAEAAAREEAHQQRVKSLKAWMAKVYVKAREQRLRQQQGEGGEEVQEQGGQEAEGQERKAAGRDPGAKESAGRQRDGAGGGAGTDDGSKPTCGEAGHMRRSPHSPSLRRWDTACSPTAPEPGCHGAEGMDGVIGAGLTDSATGLDGYQQASPEPALPLAIQGVNPCGGRGGSKPEGSGSGRHSCPTSPGAGPLQPGPRYAWKNKPGGEQGRPGAGAASVPGHAAKAAPQPYSPGMGSGRFIRRIASASAARGGGGAGSFSGRERGSSSSDGCDGKWLPGAGDDSASEAPFSSSLGGSSWESESEGPDVPPTYIPPAMLSALHSVSLGPKLLGGLQGLGAGGGLQGLGCTLPLPHGMPSGTAAGGAAGTPGTRSPLYSRSPSRNRSMTPVAAYGRGYGQRPPPPAQLPAQQRRSPTPTPPGCGKPSLQPPLQQRGGSASASASAGGVLSSSSGRSVASSTAALQRQYVREIERQAVKNIADMIAQVLGK